MNESVQSAEEHALNLIVRTGKRVRDVRKNKGISRQRLSVLSGVSPRYLAQLEMGKGNISIGLLQRIADALETRIDWLVGQDNPDCSDAMRVAEKFRAATVHVQGQVLGTLGLAPQETSRAKRICLIGLRGAGKSTLGVAVAKKLDIPFVELNREIEQSCDMPVAEVMALYGQEGYRDLEAQALTDVIETHDRMIMAVSGGVVATPQTYNLLLRSFHTIWIKALPEEHMSRVRAQGDVRPMAGNPQAMVQLKNILLSRQTLYEKALHQLDTARKPADISLKELLELIDKQQFLSG